MPSKSYRQQVRMSPETRARIAELAALWAGPEGPLTPSVVVRVCVERVYRQSVADLADRQHEATLRRYPLRRIDSKCSG